MKQARMIPGQSPILVPSSASHACRLAALMLAAIAVVGMAGCNRAAPPPSTQANADTTTAPVAQFEARLSLVNNNGTVRYDGTVDNDASRTALVAMLEQAYGPGSVSGNLTVDPGARVAPWQSKLPQFLQAFAVPGAAVAFEGRRVELSGHASEADRARLLARAEQLFPGYDYTGLFRGLGGPSEGDGAAQALARLKPGASPTELVQALNQTPIAFADGSAQVSADSLAVLSQAAKAIQANAGQSRIQITGPAAAGEGVALSQQRAEAIKVQLIVNGVSPSAIETHGQAGAASAGFRLL